MSVLEIARVAIVRLVRDRSGLFFVFMLPIVIILVLGLMYGGSSAPRLGVLQSDDGVLADDLLDAIRGGSLVLEERAYADAASLDDAIERGLVEICLEIPAGYTATLEGGATATLVVRGQATSALAALRRAVEAAVAEQSARIRATRLTLDHGGSAFDATYQAAADAQRDLAGVAVAVETVGEGIFPENTGAFSIGAQSQLILFMFLTSMTAATQLILTRQLGVSRRMLAGPTPVRTILLGETLGRFGVAMVQGLFIVTVTVVAFGVDWGDPLAASLLVIMFALVGTGAAMVVGAVANNPDQAGSLGVFAGMALGAFGGAMVPIEIFPPEMQTIAHLSPHAWAIEGFHALLVPGTGVVDILPQLAALLVFAAGLLTVGVWRFRRALTG